MAHQIAVFAENRPGRIERVTRILKDAQIDIRAITIATGDSFGVIKLLVRDPGKARRVLESEGLSVASREIVAVLMDDRPGGLHRILELLARILVLNLDPSKVPLVLSFLLFLLALSTWRHALC